VKIRACLGCGCEVTQPKTSYRLRCPPCVRQVNLDRLAAKRLADGIVPIGAETACDQCGVSMIKGGGYKQLCPPCREVRRREVVSASASTQSAVQKRRAREAKRKGDEKRLRWQRQYGLTYWRERRKKPIHRLNHRMGQRVRSSLRDGKGGRPWESLVGFTIEDLRRHLERQFQPGMGWNNVGEWHVDHIVPLASFQFEDPNDPDFRAAWALTNLRPLWATANLRKGARRTHLL
jgi:hypothetical protein